MKPVTSADLRAMAAEFEPSAGGFSDEDLALDEISRYFGECESWGRGSWARALAKVTLERDELPDLYDAMMALGYARGWA